MRVGDCLFRLEHRTPIWRLIETLEREFCACDLSFGCEDSSFRRCEFGDGRIVEQLFERDFRQSQLHLRRLETPQRIAVIEFGQDVTGLNGLTDLSLDCDHGSTDGESQVRGAGCGGGAGELDRGREPSSRRDAALRLGHYHLFLWTGQQPGDHGDDRGQDEQHEDDPGSARATSADQRVQGFKVGLLSGQRWPRVAVG